MAYKITPNTYYSSISDASPIPSVSYGYNQGNSDAYSDLRGELLSSRLAQERAAAEKKAAYEKALKSTYSTSLGALGQNAASANTGEYVRYMQNKNKLPQQAALLGSGGLSESSMMGLNAAYGSNLNNIELERARGQAQLENQLAQGIAQGEGAHAETMAGIGRDYASQMLNLSMQQQNEQWAREQALQAQSNWEKQFAANYPTTISPALSTYGTSYSSSSNSGNGDNDRTVDYGSSGAGWQSMFDAVSSGRYSRSEIGRMEAALTAQYGKSGFATLMSMAR